MFTSALGSWDLLEPGLSDFMVRFTAATTVATRINFLCRSVLLVEQHQRCMQSYSSWPHGSALLMGMIMKLYMSSQKLANLILQIYTLIGCWMNATSVALCVVNGSFCSRSAGRTTPSGSSIVSSSDFPVSEPLALTKFRTEAIQIIESRKAKGDEAFRNMDFILAKTKYEAAFDKVLHTQCADYLSHSKHYSVPDLKFPDELRLEILSSLVSLSLEINEYDDVHRWADMIIASEPDHLYYCQRPGFDAEVWRAGKACYTAYYGKAFASLKQGNPILAIENFINASLCNSRCDATYYLLENLKRAEDWKESPEASEKRRLYLEWDSTELKEYSTWASAAETTMKRERRGR